MLLLSGGLPLAFVCLQAWQQAQVELTLRSVQGVKGTPCEGKAFDVTFRWVVPDSMSRHRVCVGLHVAGWALMQLAVLTDCMLCVCVCATTRVPADRLAASSALDEHAPFAVGIPSWLRESSDPNPGRNYFFLHITPAAASGAGSPRDSSSGGGLLSDHVPLCRESGLAFAPRMVHKSPLQDLVLGPILGQGGYGKVFRGLHKGQEVAVKVRGRLCSVRTTPALSSSAWLPWLAAGKPICQSADTPALLSALLSAHVCLSTPTCTSTTRR
jgi:hypothetical protein